MGPNEAMPSAFGGAAPSSHCWMTEAIALSVVSGSSVGKVTCARMSSGPVPSVQTHLVPPISTPASGVGSMLSILTICVGDAIGLFGVAHRADGAQPGLRGLRMALGSQPGEHEAVPQDPLHVPPRLVVGDVFDPDVGVHRLYRQPAHNGVRAGVVARQCHGNLIVEFIEQHAQAGGP